MIIEEIIKYNENFVASKAYEKYITSKYPDKKLAILSCMDTRLTELLPAALGLKNGDAKLIKNAGGLVVSPFDSAMRSLLVAIYELGVEDGHRPLQLRCMPHERTADEEIDAQTWHPSECYRYHRALRHRPRPLAGGIPRHRGFCKEYHQYDPYTPSRTKRRQSSWLYH